MGFFARIRAAFAVGDTSDALGRSLVSYGKAAKFDTADQSLDGVVVEFDPAIVNEARRSLPARQY
ncbi:hypothetical protein ACQ3JU_0580 (plasmid) [Bradyrhizobium guangxiense]